MADESIRKDFVDGVQEIFSTLFNDGKKDGINLYLMSENTKPNIYGENLNKVYKKPKLLVAQAKVTPTQGEQDVEGIKDSAVFVVPVKSLLLNKLGVTKSDLNTMLKGVIEFHGVYYLIDNIVPKAYIEDIFLMYQFICTEIKNMTDIYLEDIEEEQYEVDKDTLVLKGGVLSVDGEVLKIDFSSVGVSNSKLYFGEPSNDKVYVEGDSLVVPNTKVTSESLFINDARVIGETLCYGEKIYVTDENMVTNNASVSQNTLYQEGARVVGETLCY